MERTLPSLFSHHQLLRKHLWSCQVLNNVCHPIAHCVSPLFVALELPFFKQLLLMVELRITHNNEMRDELFGLGGAAELICRGADISHFLDVTHIFFTICINIFMQPFICPVFCDWLLCKATSGKFNAREYSWDFAVVFLISINLIWFIRNCFVHILLFCEIVCSHIQRMKIHARNSLAAASPTTSFCFIRPLFNSSRRVKGYARWNQYGFSVCYSSPAKTCAK